MLIKWKVSTVRQYAKFALLQQHFGSIKMVRPKYFKFRNDSLCKINVICLSVCSLLFPPCPAVALSTFSPLIVTWSRHPPAYVLPKPHLLLRLNPAARLQTCRLDPHRPVKSSLQKGAGPRGDELCQDGTSDLDVHFKFLTFFLLLFQAVLNGTKRC